MSAIPGRCAHKDCENEAKWAPRFNLPVPIIALDQQKPHTALLNLHLCEDCIEKLTVDDVDLKRVFDGSFIRVDWERVWVSKVALIDPEFTALERLGIGNAS